MIINTGSRTDVPAYYSRWFMNRIRAGFVLVRNPYYPQQVTRYRLSPEVVDVLAFCTKNPGPMLPHLEALRDFRQFWFVTITPYGKEIEPNVPEKDRVLKRFRLLSAALGPRAVAWRYDPVFLSDRYTVDFHRAAFRRMAETLAGATDQAVISFIDLYRKTRRNFPEVREVPMEQQLQLAESFAETGREFGITVRSCFEAPELAQVGVNVEGCMTREVLERAIGCTLEPPAKPGARPGCSCLLGNDIGMYNTCGHLCRYCYANYDRQAVVENMKRHDPDSPFLIGGPMAGDVVREAAQESWRSGQLSLFL